MPCSLNLVLHYLILSYLILSYLSDLLLASWVLVLGYFVMTSNIQEVILMCDNGRYLFQWRDLRMS